MTAPMLLDDDARYDAICRRDPAAEGSFVTAVRTTKIYCRPTCSAKTPLRRNVAFFATPGDAEAAGYRACKRCRPDRPVGTSALDRAIDDASRGLDADDADGAAASLGELAARAGVSPSHFQRAFLKRVGVSPKAFALAARERRLARELARAPSVTHAALEAGFATPSAMYGAGLARAMAPRAYRANGRGETIAYAVARATLGWLLVARTDRGIVALELADDRETLCKRVRERFSAATLVEDDAALARDVADALALVDGRDDARDLPLDIRGTAFQHRVWRHLQAIPRGETRSYAQVAGEIGAPSAARAVAGACAANELAIAIPCHRVLRSDGGLGGYRWGVERKRALLERERTEKKFPEV